MFLEKSNLILMLILLPEVIYCLPLGEKCNNFNDCMRNYFKPDSKQICDACYLIMPLARDLIAKNETKYFKEIAKFICQFLEIEQLSVCSDAIDLFTVPVLNIINDTTLNDIELCSVGLDCKTVENPIFNWNLSLPNIPKPPVIQPIPPLPDAPKLKVLHLSDIHIDFEYQPGAVAECGQPLCCRNSSTLKTASKKLTDDKLAGFWGDYRNCDVPVWTVENMFEHLSKNEQFDFVYWTGDLPPHNVWKQSRQDQLNALDALSSLFQKYFPNKVIYSALGNHESSPVNLFPPPFVKEDNITWLYSRLAIDWVKTGLPDYLVPNITRGAFYSVQIVPGLRLVSLNMNYCPSENYYLYINSTDPLGQLAWLVDILQKSETIGEKVHLIGHIPPQSCMKSFSQNFYRIVNRYESTIVGQFFGHTHSEKFRLFYDLENLQRPVSVLYISGSVTTYSNLNPSYRIFTLDGDYLNSTFQVLDHETHFLNLTDANLTKKPVWQKEYSAKEAFNLTSLTPENWNNLLNLMSKNPNSPEVDKLYRYYTKSADQGACDLNLTEPRVLNKLKNRQCLGTACKDDLIAENIICRSCDLIISFARDFIIKNRTQELKNFIIFLCETLKIEDREVCPQVLNSYFPSIFSIATDNNPSYTWNITLPNNPKPPIVKPKPPKPDSPVLKILQLTDIHIDFEYQPGALAECDQPLCCRNSSTSNLTLKSESRFAGYWGDYRNCDVPVWTVENMFEHLSKNEQFDIIYWTGDLPSHNVWNQSKTDQLTALDKLTTLFRKYFPDTIIYPALGNHEATPCNLFPTESTKEDNITWLYSRLSDDWIKTGLPQNLRENITRGAFYTLVISPGLRLISLNMIFCYPLNFWLYINSTDPYDQLKWLSNILQESENIEEKVHIIGHVNPSTYLKSFSENYYRIVNRYEPTITGQFFGHVHNDLLEIFYDLENITRPVSVAYLAGSLTTYSFLNPSYRVYTVDDSNLNNNPKWIREYSAKDAYDMTSLLPSDWDNLINNALKDINGIVTKKLYRHFFNS
ncbi:unnamed protein product [Brachionus calyciflorus]|uniref:Saposin B-type domain-containing protein n=1 Tax=Brachionus calyciflorus TaxID=104777 RepID=A0A814DK02_9BILA|nr:unnamed protein product [Brachionus calyciflorus]